jgi:hypothetical protein
MLKKGPIVAPVILLAVLVVFGCAGDTPSAPSPAPEPAPSPAPPQAPTYPELVGKWNISLHLTSASGGGCVAEAMRADINVPKAYTLTIAPKGDLLTATLASASGDYACTFPSLKVDGTAFTTHGVPGYFTCEREDAMRAFRCADETRHDLFCMGQDISGRISGDAISGTWDAAWAVMSHDDLDVETKAEYTGSRQ